MHVAPLQQADATRYRALMLAAYEQAADAFTSTAAERVGEPIAYWEKRLADPVGLSVAFGAFEGPDLVGTVALELSARSKTRHKGHVIGMYVVPAARGSGAGRALIQAAIAYARARAGLRVLTLTVTAGNAPAVSVYRRAGFQEFGVEPMAICTPEGFKAKIYMWLPLGA